jgi:hypothetical protein
MPSGATASLYAVCSGCADFRTGPGPPGHHRRRRGLLRRGRSRDAGVRRLADAALQLRGSVAEARPLLLDGRRLCRRRRHGRGRTLRGGDGGLAGADQLGARRLHSRWTLPGGDRGHVLRLFRHGALAAEAWPCASRSRSAPRCAPPTLEPVRCAGGSWPARPPAAAS